jgi:hypothetical protein
MPYHHTKAGRGNEVHFVSGPTSTSDMSCIPKYSPYSNEHSARFTISAAIESTGAKGKMSIGTFTSTGDDDADNFTNSDSFQQALSRKKLLAAKWRKRIKGCASTGRAAISVWKTLLNGRNERNNKSETLRKDINLMLHLLEIAAAPKEIITKYKLINKNLSLIHEQKESENKLDEEEQKKFIDYNDLLKIRNKLYNDWVESYENLTIKNKNDINTRNKNIKSLLLSFYSLFPPLRNEGLNLKIVNSHEEAKKGDYNIYIKDLNNIWVYLNKSIKFHKPIHFNINDEVIKTFSKDKVELLILNIIESVKLYPREFLFINNKNEPYTEKGLQKMLYELVPEKNLGVNALRSIYTSHYLPHLLKYQINRVSFLMRTSFNMLSTNYLKKMKKKKKQI